MDSAAYKEHENCIRKMIIIIDLTHRNLRFILRHISKDDPSIFHDVDEFAVTAPITLTPTWLAKEATRIGDENARSKERPYSNVEIHIEKVLALIRMSYMLEIDYTEAAGTQSMKSA